MNLGELITDVLTRLDTDTAAPKFWSRQDVVDAINEGYEEISDACEWLEVTVNLALKARRTYYNLACFDEQLLTILHAYNYQITRHLTAASHRRMDRHMKEWMQVSGQPEWIFRRGISWIGMFPFSSTDTGRVKLSGTALPKPLVQLTDSPGFHLDFHMGLAEYALSELKAQDDEPVQSLAHWQSYLDYEAGLLAHMLTRTSIDQHHQMGSV